MTLVAEWWKYAAGFLVTQAVFALIPRRWHGIANALFVALALVYFVQGVFAEARFSDAMGLRSYCRTHPWETVCMGVRR